MKLIIDIPDEMYDWFENGFPDEYDYVKLWEKIKQGTPLKEELEKMRAEIERERDSVERCAGSGGYYVGLNFTIEVIKKYIDKNKE